MSYFLLTVLTLSIGLLTGFYAGIRYGVAESVRDRIEREEWEAWRDKYLRPPRRPRPGTRSTHE